jgi:hypothetical protein
MSQVIEQELQSLITQVDSILSKPFMVYDVEFGNFKFRFEQPITKEEIEIFKSKKKEFLCLIFNDALENIIHDIVHSSEEDEEMHCNWRIVDQFLISDLKAEDVVSEYGADQLKAIKDKAAQAAKDGTNKIPLDLDSVYVNMQREDWTEEKQAELIRRNHELDRDS